ncbi:MAG: hypothetical protein KGM24_08855, partial [Elusimicrobia bacterium]|nr:hypothetical protein [Elusimicrobiota bacterium]
ALLPAAGAAAAPRAALPRARDLSIEEQAGQVFLIAIDTEIARAREADIRAGRIGAVMLRWDRFTGAQARAFAAEMRTWTDSSPRKIPLLIATDHEGGPVFTQRLYGTAPFPGNMALGATGSAELAFQAARVTARELLPLGIDVTFAPDVDVNSNPLNPIIGLRSFGEDPAEVARLGVAALRGYLAGGILPVIKHFPGHGDTTVDSHLGLPINRKTLSQLDETELVPFRAALRAGAPAVMPAHMVFPALGTGPEQPVSLSSAALRGFLRGRLGFKGLLISDSLDMGAIADVRGSSSAAVAALAAGEDVLLIGKADFPSAYAAVVAAVRSGRIPRSRLERAAARVLAVKRRLGLARRGLPPPVSAREAARGRALAERIAERAVTLVRDDGLLPLRLKAGQRLGLVLVHSTRYDGEIARFADAVRARHPALDFVDLPELSPSAAQAAGAAARVRGDAAVVVGTFQFGGPSPEGQRRLVEALEAGPAPLAAVSLMDPYDLSLSTGAGAALCAYGITDSSLSAAAKLLFGEIPPRGRLPVTVPGVARRGAGLRSFQPARGPRAKKRPSP